MGMRRIIDYVREQKGKTRVVKALDKLSNGVVRRVFMSEFWNRLKVNR